METFMESILEERHKIQWSGVKKNWKGARLLGVTPLNTGFSSKILMINIIDHLKLIVKLVHFHSS